MFGALGNAGAMLGQFLAVWIDGSARTQFTVPIFSEIQSWPIHEGEALAGAVVDDRRHPKPAAAAGAARVNLDRFFIRLP